jgi:hypothetical protein
MREVSCYIKSSTAALIACLAVLLFTNLHCTVQAQSESRKPVHVLIDASKDGGLWWFPQAQTFNPNAYHQGKALADFMRAKGWSVTEASRGEKINFDKLQDADVVIRTPAFFNYTADEINAYQQSVIAGTRLILMGGGTYEGDAVAEVFGLRFESLSRFGSVKQWIPHPLTANIGCCDLSWTPLSDLPESAVVLAWLNQAESHRRPVLGYLPYGDGYVVFVGQGFTHRLLFDSLINTVTRYRLGEIRQLPVVQSVVAQRSMELPPQLLEPMADAVLPQPYASEWRFDWEDVPGVKGYEIVILGPAAVFPLVQRRTISSEHAVPVSQGYIAEHNLRGWSWRVRAQHADGTWGPWSNVRRFNVNP